MNRRRAPFFAVLALLAACSGSPRGTPTPTASASPTPTATGTPSETPVAGPRAVAVVYAEQGDLWLYDVAGDSVGRLTNDDAQQTRPKFRDANTITYLQDGAVWDRDTGGGAPRRVFKEGDEVRAFDWSPDGSALAAIVLRGATWRLSVMTPADKRVRDVKTVSITGFGRGGVDEDEIHIDWSPDGTKIAVVDTPALEASTQNFMGNTMLVVGNDGSEPIPPRRGTFARWSADGTTVYYVDFQAGGRLNAVELSTGTVTTLAATIPVRRPLPAPAGALIAYDDGNPATGVLLFNAATGVTRRAGAGLAPLWLGVDLLLVSNTRPCGGGDECGDGPPYFPLRASTRLPLSGAPSPAKATLTLDADVRYA